MRLIDANDTLDTIEKYCGDYFNHDDQSFDKNAVRIVIKMAETIGPIHFAGGAYYKECLHSERVEYKFADDWVVPMDEYWCNEHKNTMPLNGFCSEGRKDDMKNA